MPLLTSAKANTAGSIYTMTTKRRAIGIVRVSQVNGRDGESFASPSEQRGRIEVECERQGLKLVMVHEELDVSGGTPLEKRAGLRSAVEAIEAGEASVVIAAYFDRLVRSLEVQTELVRRVEAANGQVLAVDVGPVTNGSACQWLSGALLGAVSEYQRRTTSERTVEAQRRAVARGVPPLASIPPGYRRGTDGRLVVESREAPIIAEGFLMRSEGATIKEVCAYWCAHGIERSWRSTQTTLASRIVLGEIHFGEMVNLNAHPAIVDAEDSSGAYREQSSPVVPAPNRSGCWPARVSCAAEPAGGAKDVRRLAQPRSLPDVPLSPDGRLPAAGLDLCRARRGRGGRARAIHAGECRGPASAGENVRSAEDELAAAQRALEGAIQTLSGLEDVPATRERLSVLRETAENAQARVDQMRGTGRTVNLNASADWERLTLDGQRALIRATVARATVGPGRGAERIEIQDVAA